MIIYCDIDGILITQDPRNPGNYKSGKPIKEAIEIINSLYDSGHTIILWTSRGSTSWINWRDFTEKQLEVFGIKYHDLRLDKPYFDIFIDDKSATEVEDVFNKLKRLERKK